MLLERAKKVLETEARAISDLIPRLGEDFCRAVDLILECKGRVVVSGMGKSGLIGRKIASTLSSIGVPALFLHAAEGAHGDAGMVVRGDIVIALSNSGETEELLSLLSAVRRVGVRLICLTGNVHSSLARWSHVTLDVGVAEEACPMDLAPTSSTAAAMAMGDALAMALLEKKGVRPEDFAVFHPGGSLGRRLLLQVKDLMHVGEEIPRVRIGAPFKDVIYEISSKRLGVTTVGDGEGRLAGIITDGDLRRAIERHENVLATRAEDIMTPNPKVIDDGALAAEALRAMENHSITSLLTTDDGRRTTGIIHLHDILKAGIV
ncbi:MAG: SIS domain-containing protein [Nitrospinota bacterium]